MTRLATVLSLVVLVAAVAFADTSAGGPSKVGAIEPVTTTSGLKYYELKKGTGAVATPGKTVKVHYTGWLTNGKEVRQLGRSPRADRVRARRGQ